MNNLLYKIRHQLLENDAIRNAIYKRFYGIYHSLYVPFMVKRIRKKNKIKVLFVLSNLGMWKTEALYQLMQAHSRFEVMIIVESSGNQEETAKLNLYLEQKGYSYRILSERETIKNTIHPNIIFYQQPYGTIEKKNDYYQNFYALFCYVNYAFHSNNLAQSHFPPLNNLAWQNYIENKSVMDSLPTLMPNKARNCFLTGLPMTDVYSHPHSIDPWKPQGKQKKRIIYAPHHTISDQEWIHYSTFLTYCDTMLNLAIKYKEKIQIAFKPHPILRSKLEMMWGKDKTDMYYNQWATMENTQLEEGQYTSLFIHSDAMIHDCSSFSIEYHYCQKPVMFLEGERHNETELNEFATLAYDLHFKGKTENDIERFIQMVIDNKDIMAPQRKEFYKNYLILPYGNSASQNIIDCILDPQTERKLKGIK